MISSTALTIVISTVVVWSCVLFLIDSHSSLSCNEINRITAMSITMLILLFQLESLVLDNNMLTTVVLEVNISHSILLLLCLGILIRSPPPTDHQQPLSRRLRFLSLLGNRLRCDCKVSNHHHHNELNCQIFITTILKNNEDTNNI